MTPAETSDITLTPDTAECAADTLEVTTPVYGLVVESPAGKTFQGVPMRNDGAITSWLFVAILLIFMLFCSRYRKSISIFSNMKSSLEPGRQRRNMFDDTVHESTVILLLDLVCIISLSVVAYALASRTVPGCSMASGLLVSLACVGGVYVAQSVTYLLAGYAFGGKHRAWSWFQAFISSQALLAIPLFPVSMVALFYPRAAIVAGWMALLGYILARLVFVWKGSRIFLPINGSFFPFLYYLCGVEIVPVVFALGLIYRMCGASAM